RFISGLRVRERSPTQSLGAWSSANLHDLGHKCQGRIREMPCDFPATRCWENERSGLEPDVAVPARNVRPQRCGCPIQPPTVNRQLARNVSLPPKLHRERAVVENKAWAARFKGDHPISSECHGQLAVADFRR